MADAEASRDGETTVERDVESASSSSDSSAAVFDTDAVNTNLRPPSQPDPKEVFAWQFYDWSDSVFVISTGLFMPTYITKLSKEAGIGGASVWFYATTVATILSLIGFLTFSSSAEYGTLKKKLMFLFTVIGATCVILFLTIIVPEMVWFAVALYIVARVCSRLANLFYDAFLNSVAGGSKEQCHKISANGFALGYAAMICFILLTAAFIIPANQGIMDNDWFNYKIPIALSGIWWLSFSMFTFSRLGEHPGHPLPKEARGCRLFAFSWKTGLRQQGAAFKKLKKKRDLGFFLLAWMFLSDAASTAVAAAAIFAQEELNIEPLWLAVAAIIGFIFAGVGVWFWGLIESKGILHVKIILYINIAVLVAIVVYVIFMRTVWELLALSAIGGFNIGSVGAFGRSILSIMIPRGQETEIFAIYELTQKGTSWIGPLAIAIATQFFPSYFRIIVATTILVEVVIGLPFFVFVNIERGEKKADTLIDDKKW